MIKKLNMFTLIIMIISTNNIKPTILLMFKAYFLDTDSEAFKIIDNQIFSKNKALAVDITAISTVVSRTIMEFITMYKLDETMIKLRKWKISNETTVDQIIESISLDENYAKFKNFNKFRTFNKYKLTDFVIVQMAAEFYGKDIEEYISDVVEIIRMSRFDGLAGTIFGQAMIKIVQYLTVMTVSVAMHYLRLFTIIGINITGNIKYMIRSIIPMIRKKVEPIGLSMEELYRKSRVFEIIYQDFKYGNNDIFIQRLQQIYKMYESPVIGYCGKKLSIQSFESKISPIPDYHYFLPDYDRKKFKSESTTNDTFIFFYAIIDRYENKHSSPEKMTLAINILDSKIDKLVIEI